MKTTEFTKTDGSDFKGKYGSLSRSAAMVELITGVEVLPVPRADAAIPCLSLSWVEIIMYYSCMMIFRTSYERRVERRSSKTSPLRDSL